MGIESGLRLRLQLLRDSGQVDADVAEFLEEAVPSLAAELGLPLNDDTFGTALTHTAMALQRARAGEAIDKWLSDHSDELAAFPEIVARAEALADGAEGQLDLEVPGQEREFLALHLAALSVRSAG